MKWKNWSGSLAFTPSAVVQCETEDDVVRTIRQCLREGKTVRPVGAGHSSSSLVETDQILVDVSSMKGIVQHNKMEDTIILKAGMKVAEANKALQEIGLALFNTGDVDVQMLAGAISTGTHGTGKTLQNLSSMLTGVRLVDGLGEIRTFNQKDNPDMMNALRVSLGTMGVFTMLTVKVVDTFALERIEICTTTEECLEHFPALSQRYRNVDFYWYPRSDETKIRLLDKPGIIDMNFPFKFKLNKREEGLVAEILPRERTLKFDEMEYSFPAEVAFECFQKIRERIKLKHRKEVAWRVLVRTIARDDNYLSPHYGRESMTISIHHNAGLPFERYFNDLEPIFISYGGRPHWGKKHTMSSEDLRAHYSRWDDFLRKRVELDPYDIFLNPYVKKLLYGHEQNIKATR